MKIKKDKRIIDLIEGWKHNKIIKYLMYSLLGVIIFLSLIPQVMPETYQLEVGQISTVSINSPIKVIDEAETNRLKDAAAAEISEVYSTDTTVIEDQKDKLDNLFDEMADIFPVVNDDQENTEDILQSDENLLLNTTEQELTFEEKVSVLEQNENFDFLSDESIMLICSLSEESFKNLKYISITTLDAIMGTNITLKELDFAYEKVEELVISNPYDDEESIITLANQITNYFVKPNYFYNSEQTIFNRENAKNSVEPVYIKKDESIVKEGQIIDKRIYERLNAVGLLKESLTVWPYLGLALIVTILILLLYFSINRMKPILHQDNKKLFMFFIIFIVTFLSMIIVAVINNSLSSTLLGFVTPMAFGVMLISVLFSPRFAILCGTIFSIIASLIFNTDQSMIFDFRYGFVLLVGSVAGAFAMGRIKQRSSIIYAGLIVAIFNLLAIVSILLLSTQIYTFKEGIEVIIYGLINGVFSSVLMVGSLPAFESFFGILSALKLTELSNPNHPLLRKLLIETPGTYHHSIIVGNLAESAAEAIGANGLLARVGAYFHDVGKTKRPTFFVENQLNSQNPHEKITPSLSKNIIIAHTNDGVEMLKEYKIPEVIQDIVMQHHGTSTLKFFYNKAIKESDGEVKECEYRYPGPKAQTKEAAIVQIADSVEAAVRSLSNTTNESIEEMVRKIIKANLDDGQFNECDLTFKEIEIISISMLETLKGIFHSRIEYPDYKDSK